MEWVLITLGWIQRFTGMLSMLGSLAIMYIIISDRERKLLKPKNRFMFIMSFFDVIQSSAIIISDSAISRPALCQLQGICIWLGITVPLYNSSLNIFYLLMIRYNIDQHYFSSRIEPFLHAISILYPVSIAISFPILGLIEPIGVLCWSTGNPVMLAWGIPVILCLFFSVFSMAIIYRTVANQQSDMNKHSFGTTQQSGIKELKETRLQSSLYASAFILTYIFPLIEGILPSASSVALVFVVFTMIFYPLQGFWNFIFYIRPGVKHVRKENPEMSLFRAVIRVVFNAHDVANSYRPRSWSQKKSLPNISQPSRNIAQDDEHKSAVEDEVGSARCDPPKIGRRVSFILPSDCLEISPTLGGCNASLLSSRDGSSINLEDDMEEGNIRSSNQRRESLSCTSVNATQHDIGDMGYDRVRRSSIISIQSLQSMIGF